MRSHRCQQRHHAECTIPPREGAPVACDCSCHLGKPILPKDETPMVTSTSSVGFTVTSGKKKHGCPGHYSPKLIMTTPEGLEIWAGSSKCAPMPGAVFLDLADLSRPLITAEGLDMGFTYPRKRIALKWADMSAPSYTLDHWQRIADRLLKNAEPVYVACVGGHGRTGTTLAILGCLLNAIPEGECPVTWLRQRYCQDLVETSAQLDYVASITGRKVTAKSHGWSGSYTPSEPWIEGTPISECRYAPEHKGCDKLGHAPKLKVKPLSASQDVSKSTSTSTLYAYKPEDGYTKPYIAKDFGSRCPLCHAYAGHFKGCALDKKNGG